MIVVLALTGCFDEEKTAPIAPKSMEDCISIENANDRDICRMKMNEKEKNKLRKMQKVWNLWVSENLKQLTGNRFDLSPKLSQ